METFGSPIFLSEISVDKCLELCYTTLEKLSGDNRRMGGKIKHEQVWL